MIYICDIDGTIANIDHRLHFIQQEPKDWNAFFEACEDDEPIKDVINLITDLSRNHEIFMVSGRSDQVRNKTIDWLRRWDVPCYEIYMRKAGDHRQDSIVKSELLDQLIRDYSRTLIVGIFEDRKQVVDMYRARGLRVFQVAEGNF